jgi:hypothetical protein
MRSGRRPVPEGDRTLPASLTTASLTARPRQNAPTDANHRGLLCTARVGHWRRRGPLRPLMHSQSRTLAVPRTTEASYNNLKLSSDAKL